QRRGPGRRERPPPARGGHGGGGDPDPRAWRRSHPGVRHRCLRVRGRGAALGDGRRRGPGHDARGCRRRHPPLSDRRQRRSRRRADRPGDVRRAHRHRGGAGGGARIDDRGGAGDRPRRGGGSVSLIERAVREKIVLVGVTLPPETPEDTEASVDELSLLIETAGAEEGARVLQRRQAPDPHTYVGRGKAEELREVAEATDCDTVVFDNPLTPAQQYNLERLLGRTALDRTAVILDIFAQNAHSQEGKAQVELAQLRYRLPRLRGRGVALSQQAGGMSAGGARIGTRGPGETQLEVDRRRIERRIHKLEADLREIA